jgi:hypothetical protein
MTGWLASVFRHCERSEAIQGLQALESVALDCFVALKSSLLDFSIQRAELGQAQVRCSSQ